MDDARLVWVRNRCILEGRRGTQLQAVNRLPDDKAMSNKLLLAKLLASLGPESLAVESFAPENQLLCAEAVQVTLKRL